MYMDNETGQFNVNDTGGLGCQPPVDKSNSPSVQDDDKTIQLKTHSTQLLVFTNTTAKTHIKIPVVHHSTLQLRIRSDCTWRVHFYKSWLRKSQRNIRLNILQQVEILTNHFI